MIKETLKDIGVYIACMIIAFFILVAVILASAYFYRLTKHLDLFIWLRWFSDIVNKIAGVDLKNA